MTPTRTDLFLALGILGVPAVAFAQSAEETIAYLARGAEDRRADSDVAISQSSSSPASYDIEVFYTPLADKFSGRFTVNRLDDCRYQLTSDFKDGRTVRNVIDFSLATNIRPREATIGPQSWVVNFAGCAWRTEDNDCMNVLGNPNGGDFDRAISALAYFKVNFCRGKAF